MNPRSASSPAGILSVLFFALAAASFYWATISLMIAFYGVAALFAVVGLLMPLSMQMANQWEKAVVLRLGRASSSSYRSSIPSPCGSTSASRPPSSMPSRR
jgi:hypothetical protein